MEKGELAARNPCTLVFFSRQMQILFAISIFSFLVLLWAAVAMTQRVRTDRRPKQSAARLQPDFSHYLFAANIQEKSNSPKRD